MRLRLLRIATAEDIPAISAFATESWVDTFLRGYAIPYAAEDVETFLRLKQSPRAFEQMRADEATALLLHEDDRGIAIYVVTCPPEVEHPDARPEDMEIKRFFLRADLKGSGLADRVMEETLERVGASPSSPDPRTVWLSVWSGDPRAQRFYARHGFRHVGDQTFPVGAHLDHDHIMRKN